MTRMSVEDYRKLKKRPAKYRNIHTQRYVGNEIINFHSKKEAARYDELAMLLEAGVISELKLQPSFTLWESYTKPNGAKVKSVRYVADFSYMKDGELIVEDVKSTATRTTDYKLKKTLMSVDRGIEVIEI